MAGEFRADMEAIRERTRPEMGQGRVTAAHGADVDQVVSVLDEVLESFD